MLEAPAAPRRSAATKSPEVIDAMGDWLGELAPWDVFSTWTFAKPVTAAGAMHLAKQYVGLIPKREMLTRVTIAPEGKPEFFWGANVSCREIASLQAVNVPVKQYWSGDTWLSLPEMGSQGLYGFIATEKGRRGGLIHVHALLGHTGAVKPTCGERLGAGEWGKACCMVHSWPQGIARVFPYDPDLGAKHYVSKYIVKGLAEWELFGNPLQAQKPLDFKVSIVEAVKHGPQKEG